MDYRQNLVNAVKLLSLMVILVEVAVIRMIIMPLNIHEYIMLHSSFYTIVEHLILSIVFLGVGGLIFLKRL